MGLFSFLFAMCSQSIYDYTLNRHFNAKATQMKDNNRIFYEENDTFAKNTMLVMLLLWYSKSLARWLLWCCGRLLK